MSQDNQPKDPKTSAFNKLKEEELKAIDNKIKEAAKIYLSAKKALLCAKKDFDDLIYERDDIVESYKEAGQEL